MEKHADSDDWKPMSLLDRSTPVFDVKVIELGEQKVVRNCSRDGSDRIFQIMNANMINVERRYFHEDAQFVAFKHSGLISPHAQARDANRIREFGD